MINLRRLPVIDDPARPVEVGFFNQHADKIHRLQFADTALQVFAFDAAVDAVLLQALWAVTRQW